VSQPYGPSRPVTGIALLFVLMTSLDKRRCLTKVFKIGNAVLNAIQFADDQIIFGESEDDLQRAVNKSEKSKWL
jgi:hypothetical protein